MQNVTHFVLAAGLACGLTAVFHAQPALAELKTQAIDYKQGDTALEGYLAFDNSATGKRPGVLLLHRYDGMSDFTRQHADAVAKLGYVVFAPDIYGKDVRPKNVQEFIAQSSIYNKDRTLMRARAAADPRRHRRIGVVEAVGERATQGRQDRRERRGGARGGPVGAQGGAAVGA
jgi:dienelactone hydrolase